MSSYTLSKHRKSQLTNGQALVEFALVFPIFLLLVMGVIELGHLIFVYSSVYVSSREAARFGAAAGISGAGVPYYQDCTGMRAAGVRVGAYGGVKVSNAYGVPSSISSVKYYYIANDHDQDKTNDYATTITYSEDANTHVLSCPFEADLGDRVEITTTVHYAPIVPLVPIPEFDVKNTAIRTILKNVSLEEVDPLSPPVIPTSQYGVDLSVPDNTLLGAPGATVTYDLSITNTGNVVDSYTLTLSGNAWTTTLDAAVTVGAGATVVRQVTVTLPDPVAHGATDTVTITATSNGDTVSPIASDSLSLTTSAPNYGVELSVPSDNLSGTSGATVTYDLSVKNTGNVDDSFTLNLSGNTWTTSVTSPVAVAAGQTVVVQVNVTIPVTATRNQTDTVTITARSTGDPLTPPASDDLTLTTHAPSYGVDLSAPVVKLSARAGSTVTYSLSVTNLGNVPDTYTLALSGNQWAVTLDSSVQCNPGETVTGNVTVTIPEAAQHGQTDTVTITATSNNDPVHPAVSDSIALTTTALEYGVDLSAEVAAGQGRGGATVAYDLSVTNLGDIDDTYTLSLSGNQWTTTLATSVHVIAGATVVVPVSVTIPTTAKHGASDTVTITGVSTGDPLTPPASDSQSFTTTTPRYGVLLSVVDASLSGTPGSTVSYALSITNTGTVTDTYSFSFTHTNNTWTLPTLANVTVDPGATVIRELPVAIYKDALHNEIDVVSVTATSTGDFLTPPASGSLQITTTATRVCPYAGSLGLGTKSMNLLLYNNNIDAEAVTIERIDVTWYVNSATQKLDYITLRGIHIMDTDVTGTLDAPLTSSFPTAGAWVGTSAERLLPVGAANHGLNIYFGSAIDTTRPHHIYIHFSNGCYVSR